MNDGRHKAGVSGFSYADQKQHYIYMLWHYVWMLSPQPQQSQFGQFPLTTAKDAYISQYPRKIFQNPGIQVILMGFSAK